MGAVSIGASSILGSLDYSDTFTSNSDTRQEDQIPTDTTIESNYGNPSVTWIPNAWRIVKDTSPSVPSLLSPYPGSSGSGSATGMIQMANNTGSWGINYTTDGTATGSPLRSAYLVQVDAVLNNGYVFIASKPSANSLFSTDGSLSVFFHKNKTTDSMDISVYDFLHGETKVADAPLGFLNGTWQNIAVEFSVSGLKIYANQLLVTTVNLYDVSGLDYSGYSRNAVGMGFTSTAVEDRAWFDNFQVGAAVPEASPSLLLLAGGLFLFVHTRLKLCS